MFMKDTTLTITWQYIAHKYNIPNRANNRNCWLLFPTNFSWMNCNLWKLSAQKFLVNTWIICFRMESTKMGKRRENCFVKQTATQLWPSNYHTHTHTHFSRWMKTQTHMSCVRSIDVEFAVSRLNDVKHLVPKMTCTKRGCGTEPFASNYSHVMGDPLAVIQCLANLLMCGVAGAAATQHRKHMWSD